MKKILNVLLLMVSCIVMNAQGHQCVSTSLNGGRYEVIQSPLLRSNFFRLDKETGEVCQYVKDKEGSPKWQKMLVIGLTDDPKINIPGRVNYQLFLGGIAGGDVILLNIHYGVTWQVFYDKKLKSDFFSLIVDNHSDLKGYYSDKKEN